MKEKIVYNPNKNYSWEPEDKFEMSGKDFGLLLNTMRAIVGTEQASHIRLALQCNDAIEGIMATAVAQGIVKEVADLPKTASELLK
jgi:hypothetical protein